MLLLSKVTTCHQERAPLACLMASALQFKPCIATAVGDLTGLIPYYSIVFHFIHQISSYIGFPFLHFANETWQLDGRGVHNLQLPFENLCLHRSCFGDGRHCGHSVYGFVCYALINRTVVLLLFLRKMIVSLNQQVFKVSELQLTINWSSKWLIVLLVFYPLEWLHFQRMFSLPAAKWRTAGGIFGAAVRCRDGEPTWRHRVEQLGDKIGGSQLTSHLMSLVNIVSVVHQTCGEWISQFL